MKVGAILMFNRYNDRKQQIMDTRLYSTDKGQVIRKIPENEFILEFGNLSWRLSLFQFKMLISFIKRIDGEYYEDLNKSSFYRRKIRIPIKGTNLSILLNQEELQDLKKLLDGIPKAHLAQDDLFDNLYNISENRYDRPDYFHKGKLIDVPIQFHLN